jgi:phosphonate transport system substrate-binding protein
MHQKYVLSMLLCLFCFFLFLPAIHGEEKAAKVKIAILPCSDVVKTFEHIKPLIEYIKSDTGFEVEAIFPKNENDLIQLFRKRQVDFILNSPYGYSKINDIIDEASLLKTLGPDGKDYEIGYLVVRKDSGLKTIQDLKGKSVFLGMECSASRWLSAKKLFIANGIDIDTDLSSYADGGCCEDISFNVFLKAADAGLVCQHYYEEQKQMGAEHVMALAVIGKTPPTPTRIFAAHKETPKTIIDRMQKSLRAIDMSDPKYTNLITTSEISGFIQASPKEYEALQDL